MYFLLKNDIKDITEKLPKHATKTFSSRSLDQINEIIIHHTATPEDTSILSIAEYHISPGNHICGDGCPGISYHLMVNNKGEVFQTNKLETISYQCGGCNTPTVGIAAIGNFDEVEPNPAMIKGIAKAIQFVQQKTKKILPVSGHRDHKSTSCPGDMFDISVFQRA